MGSWNGGGFGTCGGALEELPGCALPKVGVCSNPSSWSDSEPSEPGSSYLPCWRSISRNSRPLARAPHVQRVPRSHSLPHRPPHTTGSLYDSNGAPRVVPAIGTPTAVACPPPPPSLLLETRVAAPSLLPATSIAAPSLLPATSIAAPEAPTAAPTATPRETIGSQAREEALAPLPPPPLPERGAAGGAATPLPETPAIVLPPAPLALAAPAVAPPPAAPPTPCAICKERGEAERERRG